MPHKDDADSSKYMREYRAHKRYLPDEAGKYVTTKRPRAVDIVDGRLREFDSKEAYLRFEEECYRNGTGHNVAFTNSFLNVPEEQRALAKVVLDSFDSAFIILISHYIVSRMSNVR